MPRPYRFPLSPPALGAALCSAVLWLAGWAGLWAQDSGSVPDVPELIIPEELRVEADRLDAEEDAARAAREDAEDDRAAGLIEAPTPLPRFDTPARRLSDLHRDERSIERLRIDCRSEISRRDVTLFANGTVRLRQGPWERQEMLLEELGPEELTTFLRRLVRIRRNDEFPNPEPDRRFSVEGHWMNACRLTVETPGDPPVTHLFNPLEMQPLPVGQLMHMAEELAHLTRPLAPPDRLPTGYEPQIDDVLRGRDGALYRVISPTDDGEGVELESLAEPLTVYYRIADLPQLFVAQLDAGEYDEDERLLAEPDVLDLEERERGFSSWGRLVEPWQQRQPEVPRNGESPPEAPEDDGDSNEPDGREDGPRAP